MLINGNPKIVGVYEILDEWIKFRSECIKRMLSYDLKADKNKLHLLEGLQKILLNINKAIKIIRETKLDKDVIPNLMKGFKIDEDQANFIAEIKLRNINEEYILQKTKDIDKLKSEIEKIEKNLNSESEIKKIIIKKLQEIIKTPEYIKGRKTSIITDYEDSSTTDVVENYPVKIIITKHGYIKKCLAKGYRSDTEHKLKDDDKIKTMIDTENIGEILIFGSHGNVYKSKISDLPISQSKDFGSYASGIVEMEEDEAPLYITATSEFKGNVYIAFDNGKVAKFPLEVYKTKQNRKKLINSFYTGSTPKLITNNEEEINIKLVSERGKSLIFNTSLLMLKGSKTTMGVQVLKLSKNVKIKKADIVTSPSSKEEKLVVTKIPSSGS